MERIHEKALLDNKIDTLLFSIEQNHKRFLETLEKFKKTINFNSLDDKQKERLKKILEYK